MSKAHVLIVDDEPSVRRVVKAGLQSEGYEVTEAASGEETIGLIEQAMPDLVILDIIMPKVNGFEVCRAIRQRSQVPIIMLSARTSEWDKVKCLNMGADDYLVKPFRINELLARTKAVLRRTNVLQEEVI